MMNPKKVVPPDWTYPIKMSAKRHVKTWAFVFQMETGRRMANRALQSRKKRANRAKASEIRLTGYAKKRVKSYV